MSTAREYFEKGTNGGIGAELTFIADGEKISVSYSIVYDFEGGGKHIKLYIPDCLYPEQILSSTMENINHIYKIENKLNINYRFSGDFDNIDAKDLCFTGRILVYTPVNIERERWLAVCKRCSEIGFTVIVRDANYVEQRDKREEPRAFISHDSRDKENFVRALAHKTIVFTLPCMVRRIQPHAGTKSTREHRKRP